MKNLIFAYLVHIVFGLSVASASSDQCSDETCLDEDTKNLYVGLDNIYLQAIAEAEAAYKPCQFDNCSCYIETIKNDLKPYRGGVDPIKITALQSKATKYQIINHHLYRSADCMFPSRCAGVESMIISIIKKLPDMELVINTRDWPHIENYPAVPKTPMFSFSKNKDYIDILYPAWSFVEGGPAISLYPTGLGKWELHRELISTAAELYTWEKKKSIAFFRGSRTSDERDTIVLLSREKPDLVNARYTKNQAWKSKADTLGEDPAPEVQLVDHCKYKFLFNYRGVAASFRFRHLFLCNSLVFNVGDEWKEFFYDALKPWIHYVPVSPTATQEEIENLIRFFQRHDDVAKKIAQQGYDFIWNHLRMKDVRCYWRKLLRNYAKLLTYKVERDENLIKIH